MVLVSVVGAAGVVVVVSVLGAIGVVLVSVLGAAGVVGLSAGAVTAGLVLGVVPTWDGPELDENTR
ncbi:hypothetical protein GCM10011321_02730 [Youhaiella tibetensis]|nr:hypothetical protein GCM10011321_02730 [Youhaiella tibetensis]